MAYKTKLEKLRDQARTTIDACNVISSGMKDALSQGYIGSIGGARYVFDVVASPAEKAQLKQFDKKIKRADKSLRQSWAAVNAAWSEPVKTQQQLMQTKLQAAEELLSVLLQDAEHAIGQSVYRGFEEEAYFTNAFQGSLLSYHKSVWGRPKTVTNNIVKAVEKVGSEKMTAIIKAAAHGMSQ